MVIWVNNNNIHEVEFKSAVLHLLFALGELPDRPHVDVRPQLQLSGRTDYDVMLPRVSDPDIFQAHHTGSSKKDPVPVPYKF